MTTYNLCYDIQHIIVVWILLLYILFIYNLIYIIIYMKIDIYNYILNELNIIHPLKSHNIKYSHKTIFNSLIYILKSNISWNSKIIIDNNIVHTNSIYKHFIYLTKLHFFENIFNKIINTFFNNQLINSSIFMVDSTFMFNKYCTTKNIIAIFVKVKSNTFKNV